MSIQVKEVKKRFSNQMALDGVSFTLQEGEVVGFLGPNGAGKSTLMKIICGYIRASSGSISVLGMDIHNQTKEIQREIGFLPEHNPLYEELYVREYLQHVGKLYGVKNLKERVDYIVEKCGITNESHKKISMLSKGYKQRVGLAQALLHDPKVLILDEPMNGLDPNQIIEIRELIREMSVGKTVLFSSHIMHEVEQMCDRVIIINNGQMVADDRCDLLLRKNQSVNALQVVFKEDLQKEQLDQLKDICTVEGDGNRYILTHDKDDNLQEKVFWFASEISNPLLEIVPLHSELEDVFKSLTVSGS